MIEFVKGKNTQKRPTGPNKQRKTAKLMRNAGLSVFPVNRDKSPAVKTTKPFIERLPTEAEITRNFNSKNLSYGLYCGPLSGGLEVKDFDNHADDEICAYDKWIEIVRAADPNLADRLVIWQTPNWNWPGRCLQMQYYRSRRLSVGCGDS